MNYKFDRQELEYSIQKLADTYPKCFFVTPPLRRPLKKNIVADLQKDGIAISAELIDATVNWYQSHIGYQYCLKAGAKRLDLAGNEAGSVTESEQHVAEKKIQEINESRLAERNSIRTTSSLVAARRIPGDQLKKIDAPTVSRPIVLPELTALYEAVLAANAAMSASVGNSNMRDAITTAAIGVVIKEAQRIIDDSKRENGQ
jgi:sRNA-binding protein